MRRHLLIATAAFVLAIAAMAGCGGDDASNSSGSDSSGSDSSGAVATVGAKEAEGSAGSASGKNQKPADPAPDEGANGGAEESNEELEELTEEREEFISQGNEICTESSEKRERQTLPYLEKSVDKGEEAALLSEIFEKVVSPSVEDQIEQIEDLGIPEGDEAQVEAIFASMRNVLRKAEGDPLAFRNTVEPFERPEELAIAYGLGSCGGF